MINNDDDDQFLNSLFSSDSLQSQQNDIELDFYLPLLSNQKSNEQDMSVSLQDQIDFYKQQINDLIQENNELLQKQTNLLYRNSYLEKKLKEYELFKILINQALQSQSQLAKDIINAALNGEIKIQYI